MIFQHTLENVLNGTKTQTRRIRKDNEYMSLFSKPRSVFSYTGSDKTQKRVKWQVGKTYAVQPARGKKAVARIRITNIFMRLVTSISDADARAEGFIDREDFLVTWERIHSKDALSAYVWILHFELLN